MAKKQYFGNGIEPSCSYCLYGNRSREGNKIIRAKNGFMTLSSAFRKSSLTFLIRKTILSDPSKFSRYLLIAGVGFFAPL